MVCFVWMIVVAKEETARFAQGLMKKELRVTTEVMGRIEGEKDVCVREGEEGLRLPYRDGSL